ncbi:hypothetical protein [Paenibacillus bouchesdurhonensis]|uniref:hypothetical protein n=1 Tax=Paenibacillus bouchesdurhonensis TaxID=1870990 RepID=UPI000DA5FCAA|nr:hypothetical protein [Paenibacillus bouchesdurhonensis]
MKRNVSTVTDKGYGYLQRENKEGMTIAEASTCGISSAWRQVAIASGTIMQPWHHKLTQIRKELYK